MAPKKKEQQKMSLGTFLTDEKLGSWADEMEDMPVSDSRGQSGYGAQRQTYNSSTGAYGTTAGGYSVREELPMPDKPPYTVHLGNLSFDATQGDVEDLLAGCDCTSIRIIEDKQDMKPKGFGYAEFGTREGLIKALAISGQSFQGRNIRISVAEPSKSSDRPDAREFSWDRKGPLADLPSRGMGGDRRPSDRGFGGADRGFGSDAGGERRERGGYNAEAAPSRDFGNWERRGPLSPLPQQERQTSSREGGRSQFQERGEGFRAERPAAQWGEGRPAPGSQDGSRPPRRDFSDRPAVERAPTAAEQDSQWRSKMRPDAPAPAPVSSVPSRDGSEAPGSPAPSTAPTSRPKLNLAKRTVSEAPTDLTSPATGGDAKSSPFGAARPIDTAAKERELEEKRLAAIEEKKVADEKAKEDARIAKEAAAAEKAKQAAEAPVEEKKKVEILRRESEAAPPTETLETENANGEVIDDKSVKPAEIVRDARPKPADQGVWRRPSSGLPPIRGDAPRGGRGRGDGSRGGRSDPRGPREPREQRPNGAAQPTPTQASAPAATVEKDAETIAMEEDGWSTVSKPKKNQRAGGQAPRAIAS